MWRRAHRADDWTPRTRTLSTSSVFNPPPDDVNVGTTEGATAGAVAARVTVDGSGVSVGDLYIRRRPADDAAAAATAAAPALATPPSPDLWVAATEGTTASAASAVAVGGGGAPADTADGAVDGGTADGAMVTANTRTRKRNRRGSGLRTAQDHRKMGDHNAAYGTPARPADGTGPPDMTQAPGRSV